MKSFVPDSRPHTDRVLLQLGIFMHAACCTQRQQYESREEARLAAAVAAAEANSASGHATGGHSRSIDFGAVGSNTLPLFNAARHSTQFRSVSAACMPSDSVGLHVWQRAAMPR